MSVDPKCYDERCQTAEAYKLHNGLGHDDENNDDEGDGDDDDHVEDDDDVCLAIFLRGPHCQEACFGVFW